MPDAIAGKHVLIIGAGLAGSLLACSLARMGCRVTVVERRADPREKGYIGGRSINLALSVRGITALKSVGLADRVLEGAIPMRGRMMHSPSGELTFQPYSANPDDAINSVSRGGLNLTLLEAADEYDTVSLRFNERCLDVDLDAPAAHFEHEHTSERTTINADVIIGADGAFSAVRSRMQKLDRFDFSQSYLDCGYKELHIPHTLSGDFALEPNALHIWPRGGAMMIALPNPDRSFTCTLFWPFTGDHGFDAVQGRDTVERFFRAHYADAVPLMPTLLDDFERNPTNSLVTIRCRPWTYEGRVALIGDAAHAIVPFFGQGMNAAFEDCRILAELLRKHGDFAPAFAEYDRIRKPNADAIADLAIANFFEMRDKVGSNAFLWKKKTEKLVHRLLPGWYLPLYNMISFSNIPYAEARAIAKRQTTIIAAALAAAVFLLFLLIRAIVLRIF